MILTGEGITKEKSHYRHFHKRIIDAKVSISNKQRFFGLLPKPEPQPPACHNMI
jgi:hypothetical protein